MKPRKTAMHLLFVPVLFLCSSKISAQASDSISRTAASKIYIQRLSTNKDYLSVKSLIIPTAFISYGFGSLTNNDLVKWNKNIREEVIEDCPGFNTRIDDYLKYAPAASVYVLDLAGVKARHKILDRTIILAISTVLSSQVVTALKHGTHQLRPDQSTYNSFPSGHTTTAFVGAELMNQELGWRSPWYSVAGYSMATGTALLRIMNNRHWLSDVIAGAGIGMLTTKFSYWLYSKWENRNREQHIIFY